MGGEMSGDHNQYQKARSIEDALQALTDIHQEIEKPASYVQLVDDKCDRIVWRNQSFRLPIKWVGLTDKEIKHAPHHMVDGAYHYSFKQGAQWAEAKLKEKNHG